MKYRVKDLSVDMDKHIIKRGKEEIELSPKEKILLLTLLKAEGEVVSRKKIKEEFGNIYEVDSNIVDVYIVSLRRKIDDYYDFKLIRTIRDHGYAIRM